MALRFRDSFDHYATADMAKKWTVVTGGSISGAAARLGVGGLLLSVGSTVIKTLDNQTTWIIGTAFNISALPASSTVFLQLRDAGSAQLGINIDTLGRLSVVAASTLGTSATVISPGVWYYLEVKTTINNTTGTYEVRVNSTNVLSGSGVDTQQTANAYANQVVLNGAVTNTSFDDLVVCDSTGSTNNDFLGDVRVQAILPSGAGTTTQWDPSAGSNFQNVDDATPDGDTTYNSTSTVNDVDTYAYGNVTPTTGTVYGLSVLPYARKDDAGARSIATVVRSGGTDYVGTTQALSTTYQYHDQIYEENPDTSNPWTISEVNAAEFGVKLTV